VNGGTGDWNRARILSRYSADQSLDMLCLRFSANVCKCRKPGGRETSSGTEGDAPRPAGVWPNPRIG
jgi:hypothetical protein